MYLLRMTRKMMATEGNRITTVRLAITPWAMCTRFRRASVPCGCGPRPLRLGCWCICMACLAMSVMNVGKAFMSLGVREARCVVVVVDRRDVRLLWTDWAEKGRVALNHWPRLVREAMVMAVVLSGDDGCWWCWAE